MYGLPQLQGAAQPSFDMSQPMNLGQSQGTIPAKGGGVKGFASKTKNLGEVSSALGMNNLGETLGGISKMASGASGVGEISSILKALVSL